METLLKVIEIIQWPVLIFFIVLLFRSPINQLINKATLSYKDGSRGTEILLTQQPSEKTPPNSQSEQAKAITIPTNRNDDEISDFENEGKEAEVSEVTFLSIQLALKEGKKTKAEQLLNSIQAKETDIYKRNQNELRFLLTKFFIGDSQIIEEFIKLTRHPGKENFARLGLGICFEFSGQYSKAIEEFSFLYKAATCEDMRSKAIAGEARCLFELSRKDEAYNKILSQIGYFKESEPRAFLYSTIAKFYSRDENKEFLAIVLSKELEETPNDVEKIFNVAYAFGDMEISNLSLLYYLDLLKFNYDHNIAWNNLGVAYRKLGLQKKGIDAYKKSNNGGETIAMANLAFELIDAGFIEEAQAYIDKAKLIEGFHSNIGDAITKVSKVKDQEDRKEKEILAKAQSVKAQLGKFATAYFERPSKLTNPFQGIWQNTEGKAIEVTQTGDLLEGTWKEQLRRFEGRVRNSAAIVTVFHKPTAYWQSTPSKEEYVKLREEKIFLAEAGGTLTFIHLDSTEGYKFEEYRRINSEPNE